MFFILSQQIHLNAFVKFANILLSLCIFSFSFDVAHQKYVFLLLKLFFNDNVYACLLFLCAFCDAFEMILKFNVAIESGKNSIQN